MSRIVVLITELGNSGEVGLSENRFALEILNLKGMYCLLEVRLHRHQENRSDAQGESWVCSADSKW